MSFTMLDILLVACIILCGGLAIIFISPIFSFLFLFIAFLCCVIGMINDILEIGDKL